jgi:TctA family transporter
MEVFQYLVFGFGHALSVANLTYCLFGVTLGTFVGVLPGIGPLAAISMILPITFGLDPLGSLIMLAGIYYGAQFGSSVTSILLNMPGHAASAIVCLDGYPMGQQGRAAAGLVTSAVASFIGGSFSVILVMFFAPPLARFALRFGPAEYFSMMMLGLVAAAILAQGSFLRSIGMVLLGLAFGLVGSDVNTGVLRLTFGSWALSDGISFVIVAMAFFAISEIVVNLETHTPRQALNPNLHWRDLIPTWRDFRASIAAIGRGAVVGAFFGALPGTGPTISSFISYAVEKKVAKDPSRFGKGAIEGVAGPESANNAASISGFIPTLTLGVPGDAIMALVLGALMIYGITPGPRVVVDNPALFWGLVASMWIGNVALLVLNIPLIGIWVKVLKIPFHLLYPPILLFICIGVFSTHNSTFDILILTAFGIVGYLLAKLDCPPAPMLLGLILGPLVEENLRRALIISRGDPSVFVTHPISLVLLLTAALLVAGMVIGSARGLFAQQKVEEIGVDGS